MSSTYDSMSDSSRLSRLERAADTLEIRDVLTRYCQGVDRCDFDLAASAFHADSTENHGPFVGRSLDFLNVVMPMLRQCEALARHITSMSVKLDGNTALSEAYWLAFLREATVDNIQSGRYLDRFERRNGEWRIAARLAVIDWWRIEPRNALPFPHNAEAILKWGKRGLDDPGVLAAIGAG
jgi:hypothetical protein